MAKKYKKYIITFNIEKNGLDIVLKIKANNEIENFFKGLDANNEIVTSQRWLDKNGKGLKFYKKNENGNKVVNAVNADLLPCFDDFGSGLSNGDNINLAIFRCVGISKGIELKINDLISVEELKQILGDYGRAIKWIFGNFIAKTKIKALITYEI